MCLKELQGLLAWNSPPSELSGQLNYDAVGFALLGLIEYFKINPKCTSDAELRERVFRLMFKVWFNREMSKLGAISLLELCKDSL
jgi:hypothetical protein